jgi:hypothetical protein
VRSAIASARARRPWDRCTGREAPDAVAGIQRERAREPVRDDEVGVVVDVQIAITMLDGPLPTEIVVGAGIRTCPRRCCAAR